MQTICSKPEKYVLLMKALLFCQNPYAFGILGPISEELSIRGDEILWFVPEKISASFPYNSKFNNSSSIKDCNLFAPDVIFVPGNEVPHYLRGLKVQIFHGFAGEKKGHFRIRHYFDLYLTQGPWFTKRFISLSEKHRNFEVKETGWSKLDPLYKTKNQKQTANSKKMVLYAPTFSPSLTSANIAYKSILELSESEDIQIIIKFHDLTAPDIVKKYTDAAEQTSGIKISDEKNILSLLSSADIMISDTSSAVYEFLLLDKPVITIGSRAENIKWENLSDSAELKESVLRNLKDDPFREQREWILNNYHPYTDGKSSIRMIEASEQFIKDSGVPDKRKLPWLRKRKMNRMFGKYSTHV